MANYDIKRGHWKTIDGVLLEKLAKSIFGKAKTTNGKVIVKYKALKKLVVHMDGKATLVIDTEMDATVSDADATATIKKYNDFLLEATGFTSKERKKRLNKKAKEGKL